MEELEAGKISGVPMDEAEVYKKLGVKCVSTRTIGSEIEITV